jgi:hypothetical protein
VTRRLLGTSGKFDARFGEKNTGLRMRPALSSRIDDRVCHPRIAKAPVENSY